MKIPNADRNARILALRRQKSFGLIAKELGISRNVVAGVCFRADYPAAVLVRSPKHRGAGNKIGAGYRGRGEYAAETLPPRGRSSSREDSA